MSKPDGYYSAEGDPWSYEVKGGRPVTAIKDGKRIAVSADDDGPAYGAILRQLVTGYIKPMAEAKRVEPDSFASRVGEAVDKATKEGT